MKIWNKIDFDVIQQFSFFLKDRDMDYIDI